MSSKWPVFFMWFYDTTFGGDFEGVQTLLWSVSLLLAMFVTKGVRTVRFNQYIVTALLMIGFGTTVQAENPPVVTPPAKPVVTPTITPPALPPVTPQLTPLVTPPSTPPATPDVAPVATPETTPTDETMTPPASEAPLSEAPLSEDGAADAQDEDLSIGEVPAVEPVELTSEMARKALDAYALASDKYKDAELENFENLQDFVDQAPQGKAFDADIKAAGFENVTAWNNTVTTISFAYANQLDDQSAEIRQQIEDLKADVAMAQDMRDRMVAALSALIPSENNKKIIAELAKDVVYGEKLKLLEPEGE